MTQLLSHFGNEYPYKPKRFSIDGYEMSYIDEGPKERPALVMVHGNPTWSFYYRKLIERFSRNYRVIVPDHIGCGLSDKPQDYDYKLQTHVNNLTALLDSLNLEKITMVLHDWGGAIGMGYAVKNSDKIKSFVIFNTAAFRSTRIPFRIAICRIPYLGAFLVRGLNGFVGAAVNFGMATKKPERFTWDIKHGYLKPYDSWRNRVAVHRFVRDIPLSKNDTSWEFLGEIEDNLKLFANTPSLLIWGMKDFCFTDHFLDEWVNRLSNNETHRFEEAGHFILEDEHVQITVLMDDFLNRNFP